MQNTQTLTLKQQARAVQFALLVQNANNATSKTQSSIQALIQKIQKIQNTKTTSKNIQSALRKIAIAQVKLTKLKKTLNKASKNNILTTTKVTKHAHIAAQILALLITARNKVNSAHNAACPANVCACAHPLVAQTAVQAAVVTTQAFAALVVAIAQ